MRKSLKLVWLTLFLAVIATAEGMSEANDDRGSCEFVLRLSAGLFCATEWNTFPGWLSCMKEGMEEFGFQFDQDYFLTSGKQQDERILACKKSVECSYQLPRSIEFCKPSKSNNLVDWKICVAEQIEKADVGLKLGEHFEFTDENGFVCRSHY